MLHFSNVIYLINSISYVKVSKTMFPIIEEIYKKLLDFFDLSVL